MYPGIAIRCWSPCLVACLRLPLFFEEALPVIVLSTGGAMEHGQGMVGDGVGETGRWVVESVWW